jgi:hypothetical protein
MKKYLVIFICLLYVSFVSVSGFSYTEGEDITGLDSPTGSVALDTKVLMQDPTTATKLVADTISALLGINSTVTSSAPTVDHDINHANGPYNVGHHWNDTTTGTWYLCQDNTDGAAVWDIVLTVAQNIISDPDGYNLSVTESGSLLLMTGAGEVGFPDCQASSIGVAYEVMVRDDAEQVEMVMNGDTTNDLFVLIDGTNLDPDDEADFPTDPSSRATVKCIETNKWYITAAVGAITDGGAAD